MSSGYQFARQQLEKYGWKEGKGLGREEGGMTEALKPKLKFNSSGLGYDIAQEYKFHWWDHAFNKAAQNIEVKKAQDGSVKLVRKEELHISKKSPIDKKAKVYGTFVKGGTLVGEEEEKEDLDGEESEDKQDLSLSLTDEELFKLCGKRTGHKGARHGLTMSAKLARVAEQDQLLMENWTKSSEHFKQEPCNSKTEKKKKKKQRVGDASEVNFKQPDIEISVVKKLKASGNEDALLSTKDIEENEQNFKRRRMKKYNHKIMECVENASLDNSYSEDLLVGNIHSTHVENNDIKNTSKIENKKGKNNISIAGDVDEHTANGTEGQGVVVKKKNNITNAIDESKYIIIGEGRQAEERKKKKAKKEKCLNEKKNIFNEGIEETNLDKKKEIEEIETVDFCSETFESRKKKKH